MTDILQPPVWLYKDDDGPTIPFLPAETVAAMERADAEAAERKEQEKYDADERRKQVARESIRREREEAQISGRLTDEAQVFYDLKLTPRLGEIHEYEQKVRMPLVQGLLFRDSLAWIAGPSGTFKSFIAADLAFRYGSEDLDYHGRRMTSGRTLLVIAEGSGGYADRRVAWEREHGREVKEVVIYPAPLQLGDTLKEMPALIHYLKQEDEAGRPFGLVVFDTQAMCTVGVDENTSEMNLVINVLHRIREVSGACVLTVHHFGKNERSGMRGSSMIYAAADTVITIDREKDSMLVTLSTGGENGKQKDAVAEKDFLTLEMKSRQVGLDYFNDPVSSLVPVPGAVLPVDVPEEAEPLPELRDIDLFYLRLLNTYSAQGCVPLAAHARMEETDFLEEYGLTIPAHKIGRQTVGNRFQRLREKGLAESVTGQKGKYRITPRGISVIFRELKNRQELEESWTDRARRKRPGRVNQEPLGSELQEPEGVNHRNQAEPEMEPGPDLQEPT